MNISDIINELSLTVYNAGDLTTEITGGYSSDLLSDVMGNAEAGCVWVTLQTHRNIAAISSLKDIAAVILVKGLEPDENTLEHAKEEGITILGTTGESFETSGQLYQLLSK